MQVYLVVLQGSPKGKSLSFPAGAYMIGRGSECHIRPNSDWVSRQHCQLLVTKDSALLRDLNSRNGTLLNGEVVQGERKLCHGDRVQVGPLVLEVNMAETLPPPTGVKTEKGLLTAGPDGVRRSETVINCLNTEELQTLNQALGALDAQPSLETVPRTDFRSNVPSQ